MTGMPRFWPSGPSTTFCWKSVRLWHQASHPLSSGTEALKNSHMMDNHGKPSLLR
jgi:hypothetical protein